MLISVVIPVYNVEKYLRQCLDSVINQTYKDLEIICVDDCSTDSSLEILKEYAQKDPRVKIESYKVHKGKNNAKDKGLKSAKGDFVHFLDPLCWLETCAYDRFVKIFNNLPNLEILQFRYNLYEEKTNSLKIVPIQNEKIKYYNKIFDFNQNMDLGASWSVKTGTKIFKREFLLKNNLYLSRIEGFEGEFSLSALVNSKNIILLDQKLINYRFNFENDLSIKEFDFDDYVNKINKIFPTLPLQVKQAFINLVQQDLLEKFYEAYINKDINIKKALEYLDLLQINLVKDHKNFSKFHIDIINILNQEFEKNQKNWEIVNQYSNGNPNKTIKKTSSILLSIIIPIYNVEKYLKKCLDSILGQTYTNLEIICVNDCSTDSCLNILEEYSEKDSRIKIINHDVNLGLGEARNTGLRNAKGEYVHFLDSDDYIIYDEAYQDLIDAVETADNPDILHFKFRNSYYDTNIFHLVSDENKTLYNKVINPKKNMSSYDNWQRYVWTKLHKREFLLSNNIWFTPIRSMEDLQYSAETFVKCETLYYIDKVIVNYFNRIGSLVSKSHTVLPEIVETFKHNAKLYEVLPDELKYKFLGLDYYQIRSNISKAYQYGYINKNDLRKIKKDLSNYDVENYISTEMQQKRGELKINFDEIMSLKRIDSSKKTKNPLITVVVPVYNVEKYLEKCLDSLFDQTYKNLEIICVDDCSTDSSREILKKYEQIDSRFKVIYNEKNLGLGLTRNVGIKAATGDYIHCLDSDDWMHMKSYEDLTDILKIYGNVDVLHFKHKLFNDDTEIVNEYPILKKDMIYVNMVTNLEKTPEIMRLWKTSAWLKLINRKFLLKNNLFYNDYRCLEDIAYSLELVLKAKKIIFSPNAYLYYRNARKGSLMEKRFNYLDNILRDVKWAEENSEHLTGYCRRSYLHYAYSLIVQNYYEAYLSKAISLEKVQEVMKTKVDKSIIEDITLNKNIVFANYYKFLLKQVR